jgi:hypothetical protein
MVGGEHRNAKPVGSQRPDEERLLHLCATDELCARVTTEHRENVHGDEADMGASVGTRGR